MNYNNAIFVYPDYQEVPIYGFYPPLGLEYVAAPVDDGIGDICTVDLRYERHFRYPTMEFTSTIENRVTKKAVAAEVMR